MTRRQDIMPGVLELDLDTIDPIAGVLCGARVWALHEGDALELKLPPECADALIMDPPAGISFMGKAWDSDKGGMEQWIAWAASLFKVAFDALKPGAHGAVWALPRTADWTMQALRRAGFEVRDVVVHAFGCLSEDTEILVDGRWEPWENAEPGRLALCYDVDHDRYFWGPIEERFVYPHEDIAYRIRSDRTDQIVTRDHRCLTERGGAFRFEQASEIARKREARVPILEDVQGLLDAIPVPHEGVGGTHRDVLARLRGDGVRGCSEGASSAPAIDVSPVPRRVQAEEQRRAGQGSVLFAGVRGVGSCRAPWVRGQDAEGRGAGTERLDVGEPRELQGQDDGPPQSCVEGRLDVQVRARELRAGEVRPLSSGVAADGPTGRVRNGASPVRSSGARPAVDADGGGASRGSQSDEQRDLQPEPVRDEPGPQTVRGARFTRADLARIEPLFYRGTVWCVRVSTGAFVARRNGKVFVTGNSGFPKSLDLSKAIDAAAGAKRERLGPGPYSTRGRSLSNQVYGAATGSEFEFITAPATPEAARWAGWGTALKPASEHWILVRKPFKCSVAANIMLHGVGGLNIDAARVFTDWSERPDSWKRSGHSAKPEADKIAAPTGVGIDCHPGGRWPSNFVLSHCSWDEAECRVCGVVAPFAVRFCPACGSGDVEAKRGGCRRVGERRVSVVGSTAHRPHHAAGWFADASADRSGYRDEDGLETVDAWECLATCERCGVSALVPSGGDAGRCACGFGRRWACAVALLDEQSGERVSGSRAAGVRSGIGYQGGNGDGGPAIDASEGGASRFFHCFPPEPIEPPPFFYSAKPSTAEREAGLSGEAGHAPLPKRSAGELTGREDGSAGTQSPRAGAGRASAGRANHHATVKGFHLIGHLCDLLVPRGGLVLDVTAGSGTLGAVVAHRHQATGWRCIMAELDADHCKIIRGRCQYWGARPYRPRAKAPVKTTAAAPEQPSLFGDQR